MTLNRQMFYKLSSLLTLATASTMIVLFPTVAKSELQAPKVRRKLPTVTTAKNKQVKFNFDNADSFLDRKTATNIKSAVLQTSAPKKDTVAPKSTIVANAFNGNASWYGPGFDGNMTANGETYDQNALTAAHPTLAFGTRVKVTNLNNDRSVIVKINDRGPYAEGRVIDLSAAAAQSLDMIHSGVAPVEVTVLGQ
nr:septal ring lytic transglycosylase RlpA family protein [Pleurocapsa sp. FMAR1]